MEDPRIVLPPSSPEQLLRENARLLVIAFHAAQRPSFQYEERAFVIHLLGAYATGEIKAKALRDEEIFDEASQVYAGNKTTAPSRYAPSWGRVSRLCS